jgi:hypothetical protein
VNLLKGEVVHGLTLETEQTALEGHVKEEFNCLPVENEEFRMLSEKKALEALKPKRETMFIDKLPGKLLQQRHALPGEQSAFVVRLDFIILLHVIAANIKFSKQRDPQSSKRRRTRPRVCRKTSCWTLSMGASGNTDTGRSKISRLGCGNLKLISSRLWR